MDRIVNIIKSNLDTVENNASVTLKSSGHGLLEFIGVMHSVQRKDIKLERVSVVVDRRINVVQDRQFEVHVVSQEGVDGEVGAY